MLFEDKDKCFWIFWAWFYVHTYIQSHCESAAPSFPWKQCRKGSCNRRMPNSPQWHCWEIKWNQNKLMTVMALVSEFETRSTTTPQRYFRTSFPNTHTHTHVRFIFVASWRLIAISFHSLLITYISTLAWRSKQVYYEIISGITK